MLVFRLGTVNSRFKRDLNLQIHLHKTFFSDDQFLELVHKSNNSQFKLEPLIFLNILKKNTVNSRFKKPHLSFLKSRVV